MLVTFAFTKWFDGCINQDQITGIGRPLVWRHRCCPPLPACDSRQFRPQLPATLTDFRWDEARGEVVVNYKMALSDEQSFEKDEWGPWLEQWVEHNNAQTGRVESVKVLRTDPAGVRLMKKYPSISIDPGVTPWAEETAWKRDKVFADLARWEYTQLHSAEVQAARDKWAALARWHQSHPTSDTVVIGQPAVMGPGLELQVPLLSWGEMWKVLKTHVTSAPDPAPAVSSSRTDAAAGASRRIDRQALGASTSAADVNVVLHSGYTAADQRAALLGDHERGQAYLQKNLSEQGALFFIRLTHSEGELAVGLGRRDFDATVDDDAAQKYSVEWFERKNKKVASWGKQPGFRLCISCYNAKRQPVLLTSLEKLCDFLPVAVECTPATEGSKEPSLSQACMTALRKFIAGGGEQEGEEQEQEEDEMAGSSRGKKVRKAADVGDGD